VKGGRTANQEEINAGEKTRCKKQARGVPFTEGRGSVRKKKLAWPSMSDDKGKKKTPGVQKKKKEPVGDQIYFRIPGGRIKPYQRAGNFTNGGRGGVEGPSVICHVGKNGGVETPNPPPQLLPKNSTTGVANRMDSRKKGEAVQKPARGGNGNFFEDGDDWKGGGRQQGD